MYVQTFASFGTDTSVEYELPSPSLSSILTSSGSVGLLVITSNGVLELLASSIDNNNNYYYYLLLLLAAAPVSMSSSIDTISHNDLLISDNK